MSNTLSDYIKVYDNVLDQHTCKSIIKSFSLSNSVYTDRGQRPSFWDVNVSKHSDLKDPLWVDHQTLLLDTFDRYADKYLEDLDVGPDFPANYCYEEFRVKMYENNGYDEFKDHVDVQDHASARRFLVGFLYLNDVTVGGETNFPKLNLSIVPKCGRMLMFPPTWQYRHAGMPPISNKKYLVGTYLHYL